MTGGLVLMLIMGELVSDILCWLSNLGGISVHQVILLAAFVKSLQQDLVPAFLSEQHLWCMSHDLMALLLARPHAANGTVLPGLF